MLQTQEPPQHIWPGWQAGPLPQAQVPCAVQVSASVAEPAVHVPPAVPQLATARDIHRPLAEQQPFGHESASQTQKPPTQRAPDAHAGPFPQAQVPSVAHLFA